MYQNKLTNSSNMIFNLELIEKFCILDINYSLDNAYVE
jgi:hypothetical protein